jgi:DNA/RNA-binding domain of Phe-tRNA-synthetase-like protein
VQSVCRIAGRPGFGVRPQRLREAAMTFVVSEDCRALGLRAGAVVFRGVRVAPGSPELRAEVRRAAEALRARFAGPQEVRALPEVTAFQEVLRRVGVNPRREQPSVERLLTFALKHGDLPAINSLVDAYNLASVRSLCSLGAHDLDRIALPVTLRLLTGDEPFTPLGGAAPVPVTPGEFGYVDAQARVLCRLDLLQADFSKVTEDTGNALLIVEGTAAHSAESLRRGFAEAVELVTRHCGGAAEVVAFPGGGGTGQQGSR